MPQATNEPNTDAASSAPLVIKIGGALLDKGAAQDALWQAIEQMKGRAPIVVVHGGGQQATAVAQRLGHEPRVVQGRRVTTDLDLEIMQWTLRGALSTQLVAAAARRGVEAVGLSGADGGLLRVSRRPPWQVDGEAVDFGWVGDVERVEPRLLEGMLQAGFTPVVAPLGIDEAGHVYNVNADTVARALAVALGARRLFFLTAAGGVQRRGERMAHCDAETFAAGTDAGWIRGGMRVKLRVALEALEGGVGEAFILGPDDLLTPEQATTVIR